MSKREKKAEDSEQEEADLDEWWSWHSVEEKKQMRSDYWKNL